MHEVLERLSRYPSEIAETVKLRGDVVDRLHDLLDRQRHIEIEVAGQVAAERGADGKPVHANEALRKAEELRRLAANQEYQNLLTEIHVVRKTFKEVEATLEGLKRRHDSDLAVVKYLTALVAAGKDAAELETAYLCPASSTENQETKQRQPQETQAETEAESDATSKVKITVLEARETRSGAIRAWCTVEGEGQRAVFGKNGVGKALAGAVGKTITVEAREGNAGLIALRVL